MQWLSDFAIFFFTVVLAGTNFLATGVETVFPTEKPIAENLALSRIKSDYATPENIPTILLQNSVYQSANAIGSQNAPAATSSSIEDALVNIYCTYTDATQTRTTTGSGFFIDPAGVIITNAHVAQFLLLELIEASAQTDCIVRTGSPVTPKYEVKLLYISPAWVQKNATQIMTEQPRGTGERDYALLFVTAGLDNKPLPGHFPALLPSYAPLTRANFGDQIRLGGFPVNELNPREDNQLFPVVDSTVITEIFTFTESQADVMQLGSSNVGQFGASGGPVVNQAGDVIGLITTKGSDEANSASLRAITLSYIDCIIAAESSFNLSDTTTGQLAFRAQLFSTTIAKFLARVLELNLET